MFYVINLDVRQSRQAGDSASTVKRVKERFHNREMLEEAQQKASTSGTSRLFKKFVYTLKLCLHNTGR